MATVSLRITASDLENPFPATAVQRRSFKPFRRFITALNKALGGSNKNAYTIQTGSHTATAAGTITLSTSSGSIAAVINGVTITVTYATSDTVTAALLAAAIIASTNALVAPFVTATSALGVVTVTALKAGVEGNAITLATTGTGSTASGARLTAGASVYTSYTF